MPTLDVNRSILINASADQVFDSLADFSTWTTWSPWLGIDPDAKVTVTEPPNQIGSVYHWDGPLVGEGEIEHTALDRLNEIQQQLRFKRPYKSVNQVRFVIEDLGDQTRVQWIMQGKLPWFLFLWKSKFEMFIGLDYDRGLGMLKQLIENGSVPSRVEVLGIQSVAAKRVIGLQDSASLDEIGAVMDVAFKRLTDHINLDCEDDAREGDDDTGQILSVYLPSSDLAKRRFDFICGANHPSMEVPEGMVCHQIAGGKYLKIRHTGSYENIGNAWSGAYQYARYKKIKIAKADAMEVYLNNPADTPPDQLITDILLPVK